MNFPQKIFKKLGLVYNVAVPLPSVFVKETLNWIAGGCFDMLVHSRVDDCDLPRFIFFKITRRKKFLITKRG